MTLSDYEKGMLIMQRAQVRLLHEIAQNTCHASWDSESTKIVEEMGRQLGEQCAADVLYVVSPRPADPR